MYATLAMLVSLAGLIPLIIVLIKLFQQKGVLHGILGIICGLYTFIWGWMNADKLGIKNIMIIWSLLLVAAMGLNFMAGGAAVPAIPDGR